MNRKFIAGIIIIFVALSVIFYLVYGYAPQYHFSTLEAGNGIIAALSLVTWLMVQRQMKNNNPQAFIRGVYSASFMKIMVCMVLILVYIMLNRADIHKPTIFILFGIYVVYTAMETVLLSKLAREKK
jgi:Kef-type K+ transport system membrane component KefB